MRIVGVLLVSSLMTLPVAAAIRLANGFKQTILYSIIFGEMSVFGGLMISYYLDLAPGGTIVMISVIILILSILSEKMDGKKQVFNGVKNMNVDEAMTLLKEKGL